MNCFNFEIYSYPVGNAVLDTFCKSIQAILDKFSPSLKILPLTPNLLLFYLKKKLLELRDAIDGYITPKQASKLKIMKTHYKSLKSPKIAFEKLRVIKLNQQLYNFNFSIFIFNF